MALKRQQVELLKAYRQGEVFKRHRYQMVRSISAICFIATFISISFYLSLGIFLESNWLYILTVIVPLCVVFGLTRLLIKPGSVRSIEVGAYTVILTALLAASFFQVLLGALSTIVIAYGCVLVLAGLVGFDRKGMAVFGMISVLMALGTIFAETGLKIYKPLFSLYDQPLIQAIMAALLLAVLAVGLNLLNQTLFEALMGAEERARLFRETGQQLLQSNQFGQEVSVSLTSIVSELYATSRQQASGAQEQAAAVMEVTTSLTELGETARQIASNSNRVSAAASEGLKSVSRVKESSERATNTADRGQSAVNSSIGAIEDVRNGITSLAERLMTLTERSRQISSIIALIKEIADETHLLALNAAIESAGSGENGRRFAVVASEVKSLADRSLEATTEVAQVITELQGAVAAAVLASEETRKKTFGAVERSYQAGQVITELGQVVDETAVSSSQIVEAVQQVATLAEEIRLATQQQESAIRQIIGTMEGVGMVAQENASAVSQVSETVSRIDNLSLKLKEALDKSSLVGLASA